MFTEAAHAPVLGELLGAALNPAWRLAPSHDAVRALLVLLRDADAQGALTHRFDDADTRFLGDLYQDLSAEVRERFALLQTPDFVEAFILDRTLEPAVRDVGAARVRVIDPTCGSGHFLLGAFRRLVGHLRRERPGDELRALAADALGRVYGSDINPYAVAIARFRLLLAYVDLCGVTRIAEAPALPALARNVVVADSLLLGAEGDRSLAELALSADDQATWGPRAFDFADPVAVNHVFRQRYHAVVGNPPYIVCRDAALRESYRKGYPNSAQRQFALAAPFTERFFKLALDPSEAGEKSAGYVGLINANSFMKREFGNGLVEKVLPGLDLTEVVDTSGAYIPGHGTPTVILFGRHRRPEGERVRVVMGRRGEPETPADPAKGKVWGSIAAHDGEVGFENEFITVAEVARATLAKHPWSLGGGGASDLKELIEKRCEKRLGDVVDEVGTGAVTREDELYVLGAGAVTRLGIGVAQQRPLVLGQVVRDWSCSNPDVAIWPYQPGTLASVDPATHPEIPKALWPWRAQLSQRVAFGKSQVSRGLHWFEYSMFFRERFRTALAIGFAKIATHNHFVLDRERILFTDGSPMIKLPASATEDDHLALLAWLNSSAACFWMKQVFSPKGMHNGSEANSTPFLQRFEFDATKLATLPQPKDSLRPRFIELAREVDLVAAERAASTFELIAREATGAENVERRFSASLERRIALMHRACALQEEIDWTAYCALGFVDDTLLLDIGEVAPIAPGERSFEIVLGATDPESVSTGWFRWNETTPATEVPRRLPTRQHDVMTRRVAAIEASAHLRLMESPICKRRWAQPSGKAAQELESDEKVLRDEALEWARARIEEIVRPMGEQIVTAGEIVALAHDDRQLIYVSEWLSKRDGLELDARVRAVLEEESVAFVAAQRHTETGLTKRARWEHTWALQRREDAGEAVGEIPVPPKYDREDYREGRYWSLRGKLDVPRERFIAYPGAALDAKAPLYGWAGWDHLQRARALAALYQQRKTSDGWDRDALRPLLAGLQELLPWLLQWHDAPDPELDGLRPGRVWAEFLEGERAALGWSEDDLRAWRPAAPVRGGGAKKAAAKGKKAKGDAAEGA